MARVPRVAGEKIFLARCILCCPIFFLTNLATLLRIYIYIYIYGVETVYVYYDYQIMLLVNVFIYKPDRCEVIGCGTGFLRILSIILFCFRVIICAI